MQEEGRWRAYAANGAMQTSAGLLPAAILARTVEITREEAEPLIEAWIRLARQMKQRGATVPTTVQRSAVVGAGGPAAVAAPMAEPTGPARKRRRASRRVLFASLGAAVGIAVVLLLALAVTGHLGTGAKASIAGPGSTAPSATDTTEVASRDVVATVAGQPIGRQELERKVADFEAQYAGRLPDKASEPDEYRLFQEDVLDYLVTYRLAARRAAKAGITVTDDDVRADMALILQVSFSGDQARFESAVQDQGLTMEQFERIYKESMLLNQVFAEVTKDVGGTGGEGTALAEQQQSWIAWLEQERHTAGVTYTNGWKAPANGSGAPAMGWAPGGGAGL